MDTQLTTSPTSYPALDRCFASLVVVAETALFMHGARGIQSADQRPTAVRGALRYWFRALAMAKGPKREAMLVESSVFGSRDRSSHLLLQMRKLEAMAAQGPQLPHKEDEKHRQVAGCYQAGARFEIKLSRSLTARADPRAESAVLGAAWVMFALGGLGARSRRGAGSFRLEGVTPSWEYPLLSECEDASTMASCLSRGLRQASDRVGELFPGVALPLDHQIPALSSDPLRTRIVVAPFGEGEEETQRAKLMIMLREFKNPAFGLPLMQEGKWVHAADRKIQHFSSPLWARLHRGKDQWFIVLTLMLPVPDAPGSDVERIHAFMNSLNGRVEVPSNGGVDAEIK
ncbi:MAG: type III-B CRISPR module RAMP protein Cmr1 [Bdellovibrionota bacterium]|nr:MAG: type III-B CRISPR module RAMP protein Cmr1 [Bdellovibrionota bacterium]